MEDINIGLWKTKSEKGTEYYRGVKNGVKIDGKLYKVTLFTNTNKRTDKSPDMTIKLSEINNENERKVEIPQNATSEYDNAKSDVSLSDEDIDKVFNNEQLELPF